MELYFRQRIRDGTNARSQNRFGDWKNIGKSLPDAQQIHGVSQFLNVLFQADIAVRAAQMPLFPMQ